MKQLFLYILLLPGAGLAAQTTTLSAGNLSIGIDVGVGARVVSLRIDGQEVLGSSSIHPRFYGSSLWLSPEGKWKGMGGLDTGPYTVISSDAHSLSVSGAPDSVRGFAFKKEFSISAADTSVTIRYTITNTAGVAQEVAPWEVTRVPTGGLAFFPAGGAPALTKSDLNVRESGGFVWYAYDTSTHVRQKLYRHGAEGWTGYVRAGVLFVKQYPVIAAGQPAPGEENVEVYVNPERTYMELENQGPYQRLAPGASLSYSVKWYGRRLPAGMQAIMDNAALIAAARRLGKH
jgi:hypothetical protein